MLTSIFCIFVASKFKIIVMGSEKQEEVKEKQVDFRKIFNQKVPGLMKYMPGFVFRRIQKLLHEDEINDVLSRIGHLQGLEFVEALLADFNLNLTVKGAEHLQEVDRVVVASNHPLGGLDGVALLGATGRYKGDVVAPVNDFLLFIEPLRPLFVPVSKVGKTVAETRAENFRLLNEAFEGDKAVCFFPFGLCSRKTKDGKIMDLEWKKTFVTKARQTNRYIVPTHIDGRNSNFFYNLARVRKALRIKANIEMALLPDEFFKQRNKSMTITFGKPIDCSLLDASRTDVQWAEQLRCFSYTLENDENAVFCPQSDYVL